MTDKKRLLILKSETHPNIEVNSAEPFFLGRLPECRIEDTLVSRKHINLFANFENNSVTFRVLGVNPSYLNGNILERNTNYTAVNGDIIEVLEAKYKYKVCFDGEHMNELKQQLSAKKRKLSDMGDTAASKKRKWTTDINPDANKPFPGDDQWESFNRGQLIVFTATGCVSKSKIAAYDMDGTLITTKSGRVFPKDAEDWKIAFGTVVRTLKSKLDEDYKIVILTNQAGVSSGKTKLADLKTKLERIASALRVPLQAFIATGDNGFRKPLTGMWQALCDRKNDDIAVDLLESYYVGDAAGRPENKSKKRKKDHSSVDRLMAFNLKLTFLTPEEHFLKSRTEKWVEPEFNPTLISKSDFDKPSDLEYLKLDSIKPEVVLMVGGPGSGKSFFCQNTLGQRNYEIVSRDKLGTWQKCVSRMTECLKAGKKVVIDNTNGDVESRKRYITVAEKLQVPCRAFVMATTHKHSQHNIAFRELTDPSHTKINSIVINGYKKNYKEPTTAEGFTDVLNVDFIPRITNESNRLLYTMYLLSS